MQKFKKFPSAFKFIKIVSCVSILSWSMNLLAEKTRDPASLGLGVDEKRGDLLPLDLVFTDETGQPRTLESFFKQNGKPVILIPSYFSCKQLCSFIFKGVQKAALANLNRVAPGKDYTIISLSFDERENAELAAHTGETYRKDFKDPEVDSSGWHFLTGRAAEIDRLMQAIGYKYKPDGDKDFTHSAVIVLLTPDGRISRYMYGVEFQSQDYRLSLVESSRGRIGGAADQILLFCFKYDYAKGKYTTAAWNIARLVGGLSFATVLFLILFLWWKERNT